LDPFSIGDRRSALGLAELSQLQAMLLSLPNTIIQGYSFRYFALNLTLMAGFGQPAHAAGWSVGRSGQSANSISTL
jgi:hypothetical protein